MKRERNQFQTRQGQQNIFRTASGHNENIILNALLVLLAVVTKYPSYLVLVFMRKRFGERYLVFTLSLFIAFGVYWTMNLIPTFTLEKMGNGWKIFLLVFLAQSLRHRIEMRKFGSHFNFDRFSYSSGEIFPFWWSLIGRKIGGVRISRYVVHVYLEPAIPILIALLIGIIPFFSGLSWILLISGICFAVQNFLSVQGVRNDILDINDEWLCRKWKHEILFEEKPKQHKHGLNLPIELPQQQDIRKAISESMDDPTPLDIWDRRDKKNQAVPA